MAAACAGPSEDPPDDAFVSLAHDGSGNYRLFGGIWEANAYYAQIFLRAIEAMLPVDPYGTLHRQVLALLKLSELVAERAGTERHILGHGGRVTTLPQSLLDRTDEVRSRVMFGDADLARAGVSRADLEPFVFPSGCSGDLLRLAIGHSHLERRPLMASGETLALVLPTAVGAAVRRHVIETCRALGQGDRLMRAIAQANAECLAETILLGEKQDIPITFSSSGTYGIFDCDLPLDQGHVIHFVLFADNLDRYDQGGLDGFNTDEALRARINTSIAAARRRYEQRPGFRQGLSLVVSCGWGRGFGLDIRPPPKNWWVEVISSPDLITLSTIKGMKARRLFQMLAAQNRLTGQGITLINMNGLLSLTAWADSLRGHLVPHERLPIDLVTNGGQGLILIDQEPLRKARTDLARQWDHHVLTDARGANIEVMRESPFGEPLGRELAPLYASLTDIREGRLRAVAKTPKRAFWATIDTPPETSRHQIYTRWQALARWLERLVPFLEHNLAGLPAGPIEWTIRFSDGELPFPDQEIPSYDQLRQMIDIEVSAGSPFIRLNVTNGFVAGFHRPENVAERALVRAIIQSATTLAGVAPADAPGTIDTILTDVMPDTSARSMHAFRAQTFHDYVRDSIPRDPILIDRFDDSATRIGLGWLARDRREGPAINGIEPCCQYLVRLVDAIWQRMKAIISTLDRRSAIKTLLRNQESAYAESQHWRRTISAVIGMHGDRQAARQTAIYHLAELSAADMACRLLVEMLVCEAPLSGGRKLGQIEMGALMADAMLLHHMGGYHDAIRFEAMEPAIRISAAGEVMMNHDLSEDVAGPLGRTNQASLLAESENSYGRMYRDPNDGRPTAFEKDFLDVWHVEFGCSLDQYRGVVDAVEDLGLAAGNAVIELRTADILVHCGAKYGLNYRDTQTILDRLSLAPRASWPQSPPGYPNSAWQPWRFGRPLSLLSRPMVRIEDAANPLFLVAPGLVRLALVYVVSGAREGKLDNKYFRSERMRSWIGSTCEKRGRDFNDAVAARLRELGWQARANVTLPAILNMKLDADYGDVDVLSWREGDPRVLCIECKDLTLDMTIGEIAQRLREYRGENDWKGRPDRLKKHLRRIELLTQHHRRLLRYIRRSSDGVVVPALVFSKPTPMHFRKCEALKPMLVTTISALEDALSNDARILRG